MDTLFPSTDDYLNQRQTAHLQPMRRTTSMSSYGSNKSDNDQSAAPISSIGSQHIAMSSKQAQEYDNSKHVRGDSSSSSFYYEHQSLIISARSPQEIISSFYSDCSWGLLRDLVVSVICFLFGVHGPKKIVLPLMGGLTIRPIPYQVTMAGDVLLDLGLANELIPKSEVTFPCEYNWLRPLLCTRHGF